MRNKQNNTGGSSNVINTQVQGDGNHIYNNLSPQPEPIRTKQVPLNIFNKQVKTQWIGITGIVALIANLMAIYTGLKSISDGKILETSSNTLFYLQIALMLIMLGALYLHQVFKKSVLIVGKHKIASHQGKLYLEEYEGTCTLCGSKLKPVSFKGVSYLRCKLYSEHVFRFNPKLFDEESYR